MSFDNRFYKVKNPIVKFFCPLCRAERGLRFRSKLNSKQYTQILITACFLIVCSWPFFEAKSFFIPFVVWGLVEGLNKHFFRKEIPCPHCGFDATWYKKDVRVAKKLVHNFWHDETPDGELAEGANIDNQAALPENEALMQDSELVNDINSQQVQ